MDNYFGTRVSDPYRWLEDDHAEETKEWVKAQNKVTFAYLEQIPFRDEVRKRIEELWNYEKISAPKEEGGRYYYYKNDGLQNQSVLYVTDDPEQEGQVFLDPNQLSADGTKSLTTTGFSQNGLLFSYSISTAGSDWNEIFVLNAASGEMLEDKITDVKFSGISWKGNEGFYYSSYDKPTEGSQFSGITQYHKLFYHTLGTPQSEDQLIFGGEKTPRRYIQGYVTKDDQYLVIAAAESTSGNELYVQDLTLPGSKIIPLGQDFENDHEVIHSSGGKLYIHTNLNAPNYRVVAADVKSPSPQKWQDIISEKDMVLSAESAGGKIFATYLQDAKSLIEQYDLQGKLERKIDLPGIGSATGFSGEEKDTILFYSFTSFTTPGSVYRYDLASGRSELFIKPQVKFDPDAYETKQIFYASKDGTRIPMFITHKKGLELNGKNPTYLYAYGGFNVSLTPSFNPATMAWLENGGIYAVPNLRGGGEYGKAWHKAGTKLQKQNVFDDFIAAAGYLIQNNYTSRDHLAIAGGSNGGLLVGAVMTQQSELAKVAFPAVGVMDMLRYNKFTAGAGWASDYGTAEESKEMFEYLRGYSPVHNIRPGVSYPATLVTTADHDDRVVPAHSFKFAATLQENQAGNAPVLIRIETDAGHGAGKPTSKIIDEIADRYSFAWYIMGQKPVFDAADKVQARK
ncbi:prolyl oligopeptidase family serine peptidase [soil metagenome]